MKLIEQNKKNIKEFIIPFIIKKYLVLLNWAKNKTFLEGSKLEEITFEYFNNQWYVFLLVFANSSNKSNRIIKYILEKDIIKECEKYNITVKSVNYTGGHSTMDNQFVRYDLNKKEFTQL